MNNFIRFLYTNNVYIYEQTVITMLTQMSKNDTSILSLAQREYLTFISLYRLRVIS